MWFLELTWTTWCCHPVSISSKLWVFFYYFYPLKKNLPGWCNSLMNVHRESHEYLYSLAPMMQFSSHKGLSMGEKGSILLCSVPWGLQISSPEGKDSSGIWVTLSLNWPPLSQWDSSTSTSSAVTMPIHCFSFPARGQVWQTPNPFLFLFHSHLAPSKYVPPT